MATNSMEHFQPSQIDWTAFENRDQTTIEQLWPPSNSLSSRGTTLDQSTAPTSPNTSVSDRAKTAGTDHRFLAPPHHYPDYIKSIESLRSFVEREIGVAAIDNRLSVPELDEGSSTWSTIDSDSVNLAAWTREQAIRLDCDKDHSKAYDQRDGLTLGGRSEINTSNVKRNLILKLKGKWQAPSQHTTCRKADSRVEKCRMDKGSVKSGLKAIVANIQKGFCRVVGTT